tara:strand:+ start:1096 stop:3105 length:2010 start_codon:yes stop_codon:yes gene_type:complete
MKKHMPTILWFDRFSVFSLPAVCRISYQNKGSIIRFLEISYVAYVILKYIKMLRILSIEIEEIVYSLGDMKVGGESMGMKFQFDLPENAYKILEKLKERAAYKEVVKLLPEEKIDIYFERKIGEEIYPIIRLSLIVYWYENLDKERNNHILFSSYSPLLQELKAIWDQNYFSIKLYYNFNYSKFVIKNHIRNILKKIIFFNNIIMSKNNFKEFKASLALHYAEGIDINTRSDIFWYSQNIFEPQKILIYFDMNKASKNPVSREICDQIEMMNMRWICLEKKAMSHVKNNGDENTRGIWNNKDDKKFPKLAMHPGTSLDKWIMMTARTLLLEIQLWLKFYRSLNIKIVLDIGVQTTEAITQSMALDFVDGIRVGIQRSTMTLNKCLPFLRYNANHLFFIWGEEANNHRGNSKIIQNSIVSGFPFDRAFHGDSKELEIQNVQNNESVKLVIALFDNTYTKDLYFSENMMNTFYHAFLEWLIEDYEIAIIIKEKKPTYFNQLTGVHGLALKAKQTGRLIRLENAIGRFPSDASSRAEIAVGIGISSAVTEAVITGCRGIHCDLPGYHSHSFYTWGYEKVIFDDISRLIMALKRYKRNPGNEQELGDWSSYIDKLDPFRDGRGGERIGTYMRWLLEGFGEGNDRDNAIRYANDLYARQWGEDKVIDMTSRKLK